MLKHLFSPIEIGSMTVKNRIMMSAMSINFGVDEQCHVTDQLTDYFVERAKGGTGMMLVGGGSIHPGGQELPDLPQMYNDNCIPALKTMVRKVKEYDTKFGVQLLHGGRQSYLPKKVAPSPIPAPAVVKGEVRELNLKEIGELVSCFGNAALRCQEAGFDYIEIHAAHGYLINQFLSPNANIRADAYGGSFENRTKFLFEIIKDIQTKTGNDFPVGIRINGNDYIENGWELKDAQKLAPLLGKAGVAYIHVSAGVYGSSELTIPPMYSKQGCFVHLAEAVKKVVSIPVITAGRIKDPVFADAILAQGRADVIALGRSLLADPYYAIKAENGTVDQIRPCIGCCLGCIHAVLAKEAGGCVVNPDVGREYQIKDQAPPNKAFMVLVTGAGPAGMVAARQFKLKGHQVVICERESETGGLLALAAKAPGRSELNDINNFFKNEIKRLKIDIHLNTELSLALINEIKPDKVVLATGSMPDTPLIKGLLDTEMDLATNVDIFKEEASVGDNVIVLGGGMTGLITADYLADQGKRVVVLNRNKSFAEELSSNDRYYLRERLKKNHVTLYKNVSIKTFNANGVIFSTAGEQIALTNFDTVVISEKHVSIREMKNIEKEANCEFHFIGDAKSPRHLMYCISEAEEIARSKIIKI